jgi:hypothetical protein
MGAAIIRKLTDDLYIIREGRSLTEAKDYIVYTKSLENSAPIKVLSIRELKTNAGRGLKKITESFTKELKEEDLKKDFDKVLAFIFLLRVKLYTDYIIKKSFESLPLIEAMSLKKENTNLAYQIALYLKDNDPDIVLPEPYPSVILDQELFEKFFKIIGDVTFRSNQYVVKRAFMDFLTEISKFSQN